VGPDRDHRGEAAPLGREDLPEPDRRRAFEHAVLEEPAVRVQLGEVVPAGVGEDHHDEGVLVELARHPDGGLHRGPRGAPDEDPLLPGDPPRPAERVAVRDPLPAVHHRGIEGLRPEVLADPLHEVGARLLPRRRRVERALGVGPHDQQVGVPLLEVAGGPRDRAPGPHPGHQDVDLPLRLLPDLRPRRLVVGPGVLLVGVLVRLERPRDLLGEAVGHPVVALGVLRRDGRGADHDLRPVGPEQRDLLLAHLVRHDEDAPVALDRRGDRQAVAGVARGGLDDRAAGTQQAGPLGGLDHPQADPILDRAPRVQQLELGDDPGTEAAGHPPQPDEGRPPHGVEDRVEDLHRLPPVPTRLSSHTVTRRAVRAILRPRRR